MVPKVNAWNRDFEEFIIPAMGVDADPIPDLTDIDYLEELEVEDLEGPYEPDPFVNEN